MDKLEVKTRDFQFEYMTISMKKSLSYVSTNLISTYADTIIIKLDSFFFELMKS